MKSFILTFSLFILLGLGITASSHAATYYVDWDNGSDSSGDGSSGNPWKSPWYADDQVVSGDTVIVYAKDDGSPYNNGTSTVLSVSAGVIFQAASGEIVRLSITPTWGTTTGVPNDTVTVGVSANGTLDGFYVWGQVNVGPSGGNAAIIKNNDLSGGVGCWDGFPSPIWMKGSAGDKAKATIQNNRIHDNLTQPQNCGEGGDQAPGIMTYYTEGTIVENNEFYNLQGSATYFKGYNGHGNTFRYNFVHDLNSAWGFRGSEGGGSGDTYVYQNVFIGTGPAVKADGDGFCYNNTIYADSSNSTGYGIGYKLKHGPLHVFNNIIYFDGVSSGFFRIQDEYIDANVFAYLGYNNYYGANGGSGNWGNINTSSCTGYTSSLSTWQTCLDELNNYNDKEDLNSLTTNPGFNPEDGTLDGSDPEDFKRTAYIQNGRGGSWPSVMGAYITGNEIIGLTLGRSQPPQAPTSPKNLKIK